MARVKVANAPKAFWQHWRTYDAISAGGAVLGLLVQIVEYELKYFPERQPSVCHENDIGDTLRWITLFLTLVSVLFLMLRHEAKLESLVLREQEKIRLGKQPERIDRRFLSLGLGLELFVMLVIPYPSVHTTIMLPQHYRTVPGGSQYGDTFVCYTLGEACLLFMFSRLFFLLRSLFECVPFQDSFAQEVCQPHFVKANIRFSIKCLFKMYPLTMIIILLTSSMPIIAYLLRLVERPFSEISTMDLGTYETTLWCTAVTMATIGYGDYYPYTHSGRVICALTGAWGAVMFSVIVFVIQDSMDLTKRQHTCFQMIRKARASAELVFEGLRYNRMRQKLDPASKAKLRQKLREAGRKYREELVNLNRYSFRREEEIAELSSKLVDIQTQVLTLGDKLDLLLAKQNSPSPNE